MKAALALLKAQFCALSAPREPDREQGVHQQALLQRVLYSGRSRVNGETRGPGVAYLSADGSPSAAPSFAAAAPLG